MNLNKDQCDALKDAVSAAIAISIRNTEVVETVLEKFRNTGARSFDCKYTC